MRLIDADVLVEALKSNINNMQRIIDLKFCDGIKDYRDTERMKKYGYALNVINEQPTAYDVDKVVEELGEATWQYNPPFNDEPYRMVILSNKAVQIVKRGGAE